MSNETPPRVMNPRKTFLDMEFSLKASPIVREEIFRNVHKQTWCVLMYVSMCVRERKRQTEKGASEM